MNENLLNLSSSPHIRSKLNTTKVMGNVAVALVPAALVGVFHYGLHAFLVIAVSILAAVLSEYVFNKIAKRKDSTKDLSAVVTGLLLALACPANVPLYMPIIGSMFAILVVKCFFGGLGKNFVNPAVTARCFLLISFGSAMTNYSTDALTSATPLTALKAGDVINLTQTYLGTGATTGVIGGSALALLIGGLYLWVTDGITYEIPFSCIVVFTAFVAIFSGKGLDVKFLLANICGGGLLMGAFFMATDPVTSPINSNGQLIYGAIIGLLAGIFRVFGTAADSFSYAIILGNLVVPFIDKLPAPKPLGYKHGEYKREFPKAAVNLTVITVVAGIALASVYGMTKDKIEEQKMLASAASYKTVCPDADTFALDDNLTAAIEALEGGTYSDEFGRTYVNEAFVGLAADGSVAGYVFSVTSGDGFEGNITLSVGFKPDGTLTSIEFTELNETAGMGMKCGDDEFKSQFNGVNTDAFILNKAGGSTADNEIDSVSGASTSSGAVVNAVNTAIAFFHENVQ